MHLHSLGLPGQCIVVEITEGLLLDTSTHRHRPPAGIPRCRHPGVAGRFRHRLFIAVLPKKFDIDYLKIDQSFVRNLAPGSSNMALCEAIIVMAHKLGMKVIAEGIETEQQRDLLTLAGCDYGQGFLFSKPVPAEQFEALYIKQQAPSQTHLHFDA